MVTQRYNDLIKKLLVINEIDSFKHRQINQTTSNIIRQYTLYSNYLYY